MLMIGFLTCKACMQTNHQIKNYGNFFKNDKNIQRYIKLKKATNVAFCVFRFLVSHIVLPMIPPFRGTTL